MTRRSPELRPTHAVSGRHGTTLRFFHGDCLEVLERLSPGSVDVVVTSPPYNLGVRYRSYDDRLPRDAYLAWTSEWTSLVARALKPEGSLFLNVGAKPTDPWAAFDVAQNVRPHLTLQNTIHWVKSIVIDHEYVGERSGLTRDLAVGHYKPINSERFLNDCHEFIFHFTPSGHTPLERLAIGVPYQDASNVARWQGSKTGLRCRGNTWFIPYETIQSRDRQRPHPATFPSRLPERCLQLHGVSHRSLVVDPFLGLGSTAVACARTGVSFMGMELDPEYLQVAVERTQTALGETVALAP
ncbi:MAG: site-specific DNA-methyltransferase [Vicinamibacterales bacterium]